MSMNLRVRRVRVVTVADLVDVQEDGTESVVLEAVAEDLARALYQDFMGKPWTGEEARADADEQLKRLAGPPEILLPGMDPHYTRRSGRLALALLAGEAAKRRR